MTIISEILLIISLFLKNWGWLILPILLFFPARFLYFWWIRWDVWYKKHKWILLEIKPPKEILAPFKAMEDVYSLLWGIYDSPTWKDVYCEGQLPYFSFWLSFEIASIEGEVHFYVRALEAHRQSVESAIYSHYPDAEISLVEDYTKNVPQNVPNKDWDIYGSDLQTPRDDFYPLKTYAKFFEESLGVKEEKRIDPLTSLMEAMSELKKGEQFWLQFVIVPIQDRDIPWTKRGKAVAERLSKPKTEGKKQKSMISGIFDIFVSPPSVETGPKTTPFEWMPELTPGVREVIRAIEDKISKFAYKTNIRGIYIAKRDNWFNPHRLIGQSYFLHFGTVNLNTIYYWDKTRTKIRYFLADRRNYLRKRKIFRNYINRFPPLWPRLKARRATFILNTEELATMYHFPTKAGILAPTVPRVEAKKGGPPPSLPIE